MSTKAVMTKLEQIEATLKSMSTTMKSLDDRVKKLEETEKSEVSPYMQSVSEAPERTLRAVKGLTKDPSSWVSISRVATHTRRSPPTESSYLHDLYEQGLLDRHVKYIGTGKNRRRTLEYRAKE